MRRHIFEVWFSLIVPGNAIPVIRDSKKGFTMFASAGDRNVARVGVDTVFNELCNCLQRVRLRQGDDIDRIPVIANPQLSGLSFLTALFVCFFCKHNQSSLGSRPRFF